MMQNKFLNIVLSIILKKPKRTVTGIVLDYNDDWTLMKYIPDNFVIDGYSLLHHKYTKEYECGKDEKLKEKVLKLKKEIGTKNKFTISLAEKSIAEILKIIATKYKFIEVYVETKGKFYVGKIVKITNKSVTLKDITPEGKWDENFDYDFKDIREIRFDTDYVNSLSLLLKGRK